MSLLKNALTDLAMAENDYYSAQEASTHEHTGDIDQALDALFCTEYEVIFHMQNPLYEHFRNEETLRVE